MGTLFAVVLSLPSNAFRPVTVFVPKHFDPARPVRIVLYLHGIGGGAKDLRVDPDGDALTVVPHGVPGSRRPWPEEAMSFRGIEREAIAALALPIVVSGRTVIAHSAGGKAVAAAARRGDLQADKLVLLDCFYGRWHEPIAEWASAHAVSVAYYRASNDPRLGAEFFRTVSGTAHTTSASHFVLPQLFAAP